MRHHDPLVSRQGHGAFDGVKTRTDSLFTAHLMLKKKALQGAAPGELSRFERGPLAQKVTKEPGFLIPTVSPLLTPITSRNVLLLQLLPHSIPYRQDNVRRRKDDPCLGTATRSIVERLSRVP